MLVYEPTTTITVSEIRTVITAALPTQLQEFLQAPPGWCLFYASGDFYGAAVDGGKVSLNQNPGGWKLPKRIRLIQSDEKATVISLSALGHQSDDSYDILGRIAAGLIVDSCVMLQLPAMSKAITPTPMLCETLKNGTWTETIDEVWLDMSFDDAPGEILTRLRELTHTSTDR